ncbi:MAG: TRAP transporter small permease [Rhodospirillales bacterium]|nr:MAG: TRAP transporter small permease [Rhodospirillales bacterium]
MPSDNRAGAARRGGPVLAALDRLTALASRLFVGLGAAIAVIMAVAITYSVVMRYVLNTPQVWTDELMGYLMVALVMFGLGETVRRGDHINVDLIIARLGPRGQVAARVWGLVAMITVAAVLLERSWDMVAFSRMVGLLSDGYLAMPVWIPQSSLLIGFALMILASVNQLLRLALGLDAPPHRDAAHVPD